MSDNEMTDQQEQELNICLKVGGQLFEELQVRGFGPGAINMILTTALTLLARSNRNNHSIVEHIDFIKECMTAIDEDLNDGNIVDKSLH